MTNGKYATMTDEQRGIHDLITLGALRAEQRDDALGIMLKYKIPVGELAKHLTTKERGLGSARCAASFVAYFRTQGEHISLDKGYALWQNLRDKFVNEDYAAINEVETSVLEHLTGQKMVVVPNEAPGRTRDHFLRSYLRSKRSYFTKDNDEELARERADPAKAISFTRSLIRRGIFSEIADIIEREDAMARGEPSPIPIEPDEVPVNHTVLEHYIPEVTGGAPIRRGRS